jgi:coenzyme F420-0:L-glutamate ligase / coenzyme F420-1:gamma-L-glutamate ligase
MTSLIITPISAPVQTAPFPLIETLTQALQQANYTLQEGDVVAISSKYVAISEGRIVTLDEVQPGARALELAARYHMDARMAQLVVQEAEHIFGGIPIGYLLTWRQGVISPNAGIDRSNIPAGYAVLLPADSYVSARQIREALQAHYGVRLGVILTDSWLVPGRWGTTGVSLGASGFLPVEDERGKPDLFGSPMQVTQRGVADALSVAAQATMGERDEATPLVVLRGAKITLTDEEITTDRVSIPWDLDLYVESLTVGLLPDGAPRESLSARFAKKMTPGG